MSRGWVESTTTAIVLSVTDSNDDQLSRVLTSGDVVLPVAGRRARRHTNKSRKRLQALTLVELRSRTRPNAEFADVIEAEELNNFVQIGAEVAMTVQGSLVKDRVAYKSSVEALFPFYNSINPQDKSVLGLTNVEWMSQISFKLVEWASLDYQVRVVRQPLIVEDWQVQNTLLLTFGYTLIDEVEK